MDFWDITKLLFRRWLIALPLLGICGALAMIAIVHVKPDYVATSYVQLVPPVTGETQPGQPSVDQRNPWIGLGLQTIGNAAIVTVTDSSLADQLKASGYSDSYTVTMGQSSPLITFEVIGNTPAQANRTTVELIDRFDGSLTSLQATYGVKQADMITGHRLDVGTNIKESNSKVKRAAVAVIGAGFLFTIAGTVGIDAWLRRRRRKRESQQPVAVPAPVEVVEVETPKVPQRGLRLTGDHVSESRFVTISGPAEVLSDRDGALTGLNVELTQPLGWRATGPAKSPAPEDDTELADNVPSDATVVLPTMSGQTRSPGRNGQSD